MNDFEDIMEVTARVRRSREYLPPPSPPSNSLSFVRVCFDDGTAKVYTIDSAKLKKNKKNWKKRIHEFFLKFNIKKEVGKHVK